MDLNCFDLFTALSTTENEFSFHRWISHLNKTQEGRCPCLLQSRPPGCKKILISDLLVVVFVMRLVRRWQKIVKWRLFLSLKSYNFITEVEWSLLCLQLFWDSFLFLISSSEDSESNDSEQGQTKVRKRQVRHKKKVREERSPQTGSGSDRDLETNNTQIKNKRGTPDKGQSLSILWLYHLNQRDELFMSCTILIVFILSVFRGGGKTSVPRCLWCQPGKACS